MHLPLRRFSIRHLPGGLLLVFLCTAMAGPEFVQSPATILTVINTADSGLGSLRAALASASDGDTIQFAATLNGQTIGLTSGELVINKNITIDGPGSNLLTVSRSSGSFRIFHVMPSRTVIIEGLTITQGSANIGGGILNDHATLTVDSCKVQLNSAPGGFGGGIFNYGTGSSGSTLTILNSTINNNNATAGGGGIANDVSTGGSLTITNSVVTSNAAGYADSPLSYGKGGGIYDIGGTATLRISNTIVSNNRAGPPAGAHYPEGYGGGLYHSSGSGGAVIITDSTITGNSVGFAGGGIAGYGTQTIMTITGSTLSNNSAFGTFESQPVTSSGGGIDNEGTLTIIDSTLSGNSAFSYGGGINGGTLTIANSTLSGNTANNGGGLNAGTVDIGNTILKAGTSGSNIVGGMVTSHGYNLSSDNGSGFLTAAGDQINTDPMLGPLQNNGGPTFTHDLLTGSPARDAGDPTFTPPPLYDQRGSGYDRVVNGRIDIGALEVQAAPTPTPTPTATATATTAPTITPTPTPVTTHFSVTAPGFVIQYFPFNITVTAQDQFNNTVTSYTGTVHFTSTDTGVIGTQLPANSTLTNGTGTFSVRLGTPGNQTITATDTSNASITGTSNTIFVQAKVHPTPTATATATAIPATPTPTAPATATTAPTITPTPTPVTTHFSVTAPGFVTQYFPFNITVTARDQFNNAVTSYTGTVHFTSTDTGVNGTHLPADSTLTNGTGTFSVMLGTPGNQTITATDTSDASITDTSNNIFVQAKGSPTPPPPTPTATATATATPPTATPSPPITISGTISYCSNPVLAPVPNVTLALTGSMSDSTLSDGSGNYTLSSLPSGGSYTVTPTNASLAPGATGINTVDVIAVQRHFLTLALLSGCRLAAADVNGNNAVDTVDVIAVQRFFLGRTTGFANVGTYQFTPASRSYPNVVSNQSGQNYDTLVFGDVAPPFVE